MAAAGGCLGGKGNISSRLGELRIRYGELVSKEKKRGEDGNRTSRAGLGTVEESVPLKRGRRYGVEYPEWI